MTIEELIPKIMEHASEYAVESEEQIFVGMVPARHNKKKRIQKKWIKKYGMKPVYKTKKCRKIEVTIPLILDFCSANTLPIPDELLEIMNGGNENG